MSAELHGSCLRVDVHVQPRASRSRIVGWHGKALKIQVNAPPVDGAANTEVAAVLAACLGVARSQVRLIRGASSRQKTFEVDPAPDDSLAKIEAACVDKPQVEN